MTFRLSRSFLMTMFACAIAAGCSTPKVGDPCLPEQVPEDGFNAAETYIETNSVQCETRVCIVHKFSGSPLEEIDKGNGDEVAERVHCSCRCDAPSPDFNECSCPAGYTCREVLEEGGPGIQGGYCVNVATQSGE